MAKMKDQQYATLVREYMQINRTLKEYMEKKRSICRKVSKRRKSVIHQHNLWLRYLDVDRMILESVKQKNTIVKELIPYAITISYLKKSGMYDIVEIIVGRRRFHWAGRKADFPGKIIVATET